MPLVVKYCQTDDDELREYCLQAFESFVRRCPKEVSPFIPEVSHSSVYSCRLEVRGYGRKAKPRDSVWFRGWGGGDMLGEALVNQKESWLVSFWGEGRGRNCLATCIMWKGEMG